MLATQNVDFIVGPYGQERTMMAAMAASEFNVTVISPSAVNESVATMGLKSLVSLMPTTEAWARAVAEVRVVYNGDCVVNDREIRL